MGKNEAPNRLAALRRDIRTLTKLAKDAARNNDTQAFIAASKARDERAATLAELLEGKTPPKPETPTEITFRDPEAIGFRVFYENPPEEKTILSKLAWFGVISEPDRAELVRCGIIFDREKLLQLNDEDMRLKKIADADDKQAVN